MLSEITNSDLLTQYYVNLHCFEDIIYTAYIVCSSSDQLTNAHSMLSVKLIPELLTRLHDNQLSDSTIKAMINVVNALMSHGPSNEDIRR